MNNLAKGLGPCSDVVAVSEALLKLCAPYGAVVKLQILTASYQGRQHALCFLSLTPPEAEERLMLAIGAQRCDGRLTVVVQLQPAIQPIQLRPSTAKPLPSPLCPRPVAHATDLAWPQLHQIAIHG
jgi:hypothetical protein